MFEKADKQKLCQDFLRFVIIHFFNISKRGQAKKLFHVFLILVSPLLLIFGKADKQKDCGRFFQDL